jgi:outer membrane protein
MKKITFLVLLSALTLSTIAQNKFGHINAQEILLLMPDTKEAEKKLLEKENDIKTALQRLYAEAEAIELRFQQNEANLNELEKQDAQKEYQNIAERVQLYERTGQEDYQKMQQELLVPINKKLKDAISEVAVEGNYTYIFANEILHYKDEKNDVSALVKKKLGL